jgi:hypothetical protein
MAVDSRFEFSSNGFKPPAEAGAHDFENHTSGWCQPEVFYRL